MDLRIATASTPLPASAGRPVMAAGTTTITTVTTRLVRPVVFA
ncbi:hypothetical protein [Stenotrophomonas sp. GZD-301]|jgi:hypothetical protein